MTKNIDTARTILKSYDPTNPLKTMSDIRKAFLIGAIKCHPDRAIDPDLKEQYTEKFKLLNEARDVLESVVSGYSVHTQPQNLSELYAQLSSMEWFEILFNSSREYYLHGRLILGIFNAYQKNAQNFLNLSPPIPQVIHLYGTHTSNKTKWSIGRDPRTLNAENYTPYELLWVHFAITKNSLEIHGKFHCKKHASPLIKALHKLIWIEIDFQKRKEAMAKEVNFANTINFFKRLQKINHSIKENKDAIELASLIFNIISSAFLITALCIPVLMPVVTVMSILVPVILGLTILTFLTFALLQNFLVRNSLAMANNFESWAKKFHGEKENLMDVISKLNQPDIMPEKDLPSAPKNFLYSFFGKKPSPSSANNTVSLSLSLPATP